MHTRRVLAALAAVASCAQEQVEDLNTHARTWDSLKLSPEDEALFNMCESKTAGSPDEVVAILKAGASPSVQGEYNYTALMWTVVRKKPQQARLLLEAGADTETINAWGRNAMFIGERCHASGPTQPRIAARLAYPRC